MYSMPSTFQGRIRSSPVASPILALIWCLPLLQIRRTLLFQINRVMYVVLLPLAYSTNLVKYSLHLEKIFCPSLILNELPLVELILVERFHFYYVVLDKVLKFLSPKISIWRFTTQTS